MPFQDTKEKTLAYDSHDWPHVVYHDKGGNFKRPIIKRLTSTEIENAAGMGLSFPHCWPGPKGFCRQIITAFSDAALGAPERNDCVPLLPVPTPDETCTNGTETQS